LSSIVSGLSHLSAWVAYSVIAALVFGETAVFLGFVLPGEAAVVLGGVLASRGHLSLPVLVAVVVVTALAGPLVGYEIGRRLGDRVFAARVLRRVPGGPHRARIALRDRGGLAVLLGRFVAILRALMPAAAGAVRVPYRTFFVYNLLGGIIWGVGYCLLGYLAGSAYSVIESRIGAGLAIAVAAIVVAAAAVLAVRRHRAPAPGASGAAASATDAPDASALGTAVSDGAASGAGSQDGAVQDLARAVGGMAASTGKVPAGGAMLGDGAPSLGEVPADGAVLRDSAPSPGEGSLPAD
jgi:membrane-associated protein